MKQKTYSAKNFLNDSEEDKTVEAQKQKKLEAKQGGGVTDRVVIIEDVTTSGKSIEDIIYDIVAEWFAEHYEEEVKKKLLSQL